MDTKIKLYDVIVIYSESIANSAKNKLYKEKAPFSSKGSYGSWNDSYTYFLLRCKKMGIRAAFATSKDIIGPGLFQSFWTYDKEWVRNSSKAYSRILFDKFTPTRIEQKNKLKLLTSSKDIHLFSSKKLTNIFKDKLNTNKHFKEFIIPTVEIANFSKQKILLAKIKLDELLKKHKFRIDFNYTDYVIKDRRGSEGYRTFKINFRDLGNDLKKIWQQYESDKKDGKKINYILQPFINCDKSVLGEYNGFIDLRAILLNNRIIQTYIRIAKKGEFRANISQGGDIFYISKEMIPKDILMMIQKITKKLKKFKYYLYSLDFIRSNNGNLYFVEGNHPGPGINWKPNDKIDKMRSKELINIIVNKLKSIIEEKEIK